MEQCSPRQGWGDHAWGKEPTHNTGKTFANRKRSQKDRSQRCQLGEMTKRRGYLHGPGGEQRTVSHAGGAEVPQEHGHLGAPRLSYG